MSARKQSLINDLVNGDMRTTGVSAVVATQALTDPTIILELVTALAHPHPGVRMRSADALEKINSQHPQLLFSYKKDFLTIGHSSTQKEVQWHLAQIIPTLPLSKKEAKTCWNLFFAYFSKSTSSIVRAFSLSALAHLSCNYQLFPQKTLALLHQAAQSSTPSIKSRATILLKTSPTKKLKLKTDKKGNKYESKNKME